MKKFIIMVFVLIFAFSLMTACGADKEKPAEIKPTSTSGTSSSNEYEKGTFTETEFSSEYLSLRFSLPEGFVMATEEEINEMMGLGADALGIDSALVEYAELTTVYEMTAISVDGSTNVIVFSEKLGLRNITVEQYFTALKAQLQEMPNAEYIIDDEIITVEIAGKAYEQMTASTSAYGVDMVQQYMMRKIDNRMVGVVTTCTPDTEDILNTLMEGFSAY